MKRANSFAFTLAATTLILSGFAAAQEKEPQICADAAFEVIGETRYALLSARQLSPGRERYRLKLEAVQSGAEVICKIRRGQITTLQIDLPETAEGLVTTS